MNANSNIIIFFFGDFRDVLCQFAYTSVKTLDLDQRSMITAISTGSQPVTLSSGAPGSAEATGGAQQQNSALPVAMIGNTNLLALTGSALLAVAAGARVLF